MFWQRALTAAVGIPLLLAVIYAGGWWLGGAVFFLSVVGLSEFFRLVVACGIRPDPILGHAAGGLLILATAAAAASATEGGTFAENQLNHQLVVLLTFTVIAVLLRQVLAGGSGPTAANAGATLLGVTYIPFLFSFLIRLRALTPADSVWLLGLRVPAGACWLGLVVITCWVEDTVAYGVGKAVGRHKLCPAISPGKTVEGAVAALVAAVVTAAILGYWFARSAPLGLALGAIIGVAGQIGDLSKSVLKRQAQVKDSGNLIPGHGGVLDRFDSLLFSAPLAFHLLRHLAW